MSNRNGFTIGLSMLLVLVGQLVLIQARPSNFGHQSAEEHQMRGRPKPRRLQHRIQRLLPRHLLQGGRPVALTTMTHYTLAASPNGLTYSQRYTRHLNNSEGKLLT